VVPIIPVVIPMAVDLSDTVSNAEKKLNVLIPSVTSLTLLPDVFQKFLEVKGHMHI